MLAFDTGPANALIDEAAARAGQRRDEGGRLADAGRIDETLVERWLEDPYLSAPPPKSTGRERWTLGRMEGAQTLSVPDLAATVTAFSARSVALAYRRFVLPLGLDEIVVAGGGAYNPVFMRHLRVAVARPGAHLRGARLEFGRARGRRLRAAGLLRVSGLAQHPAAHHRGAPSGHRREAVAALAGRRMTANAFQLVEEAVKAGVVPGAALGVLRLGEAPRMACWGLAQRVPEERPLTLDGVFDLASLTKVLFTVPEILRVGGRRSGRSGRSAVALPARDRLDADRRP